MRSRNMLLAVFDSNNANRFIFPKKESASLRPQYAISKERYFHLLHVDNGLQGCFYDKVSYLRGECCVGSRQQGNLHSTCLSKMFTFTRINPLKKSVTARFGTFPFLRRLKSTTVQSREPRGLLKDLKNISFLSQFRIP